MTRPDVLDEANENRHSLRRPRFLDLPPDILHLLILIVGSRSDSVTAYPLTSTMEHIRAQFRFSGALIQGHPHELLSLSSTCTTLREYCMPIMFRAITISNPVMVRRHGLVPPDKVLYLVHDLHLRRLDAQSSRDAYLTAARSMPKLRRIYIDGAAPPSTSVDLLALAFCAPGIETLVIKDVELTAFPVAGYHAPPPHLRALRIGFEARSHSLADLHSYSLVKEIVALNQLVNSVRTSVEDLLLPAESVRFSTLCAAWPNLRSLTLYGLCPSLDGPMVQMLRFMPLLHELVLALAPRTGASPVVICPPGTDGIPPDLSMLRRFTLAYPSDDDMIFAHLPSTVRAISLCDAPRYYERQSYDRLVYDAPVLSCTSAQRIFGKLNGEYLHTLELVVIEDGQQFALLAHIASCCPNLRVFEVHCYRAGERMFIYGSDEEVVPVSTFASALSAFKALHMLKINFDFPNRFGRPTRKYFIPDPEGACRFVDGHARTVANALPWLTRLAILARPNNGSWMWRTWTVHVAPDGTTELALEDFPDAIRQ